MMRRKGKARGTHGTRRAMLAGVTGLLVGVGLVAVASPAIAGSARPGCAAPVSAQPGRVGKMLGIVHAPLTHGCVAGAVAAAAEPPYTGTPPLRYHGGDVMGTPSDPGIVVTPIYWAPSGYSFSASYKSIIDGYITDVAADAGKTTNVYAALPQYAGSGGTVNYRIVAGSPLDDTASFPASGGCTPDTGTIYSDGSGYTACVTDAQMRTELTSFLAAHGLTEDLNHLYPVFLPEGVESCYYPDGTPNQECTPNSSGTSAFCAYHSWSNLTTIYADMPYPASYQGTTCLPTYLPTGVQSPNGDVEADQAVSSFSHELSESITDPNGLGWYDSSGLSGEIADECNYIYGPLQGSTPGAEWNQTINGTHYFTQEEFSNADYVPNQAGCVQEETSTPTPAPAVTSVSPSSGPTAGGQSVTVTGTGFTGATAVDFGAVGAGAFTVDSDTQITATTPAHAAGQVDVTVSTPAGTSATGAVDQYTFTAPTPAPAVTSVSPSSGPTAGGQSVTITGTGFTGATAVDFGAVGAGAFTVDSDTQITATTPAHAAGQVDVTVSTPAGTSATGAADQYTFMAPTPGTKPTVTAVSPRFGPAEGGQTVTITGSGFTGATAVHFGWAAAGTFSVDSDTQITVISPAHRPDTVDVRVTTPAGTSSEVHADRYLYYHREQRPVVTSVSPNLGPARGGQTVTIIGSGFTGATAVHFGWAAAGRFTVDSDTRITVISPAHRPDTVDVRVTTREGTSSEVRADRYRFVRGGGRRAHHAS